MFLAFETEIEGSTHARPHLIVPCYSCTKYWLLTMWLVLFWGQWGYGQYSQELSLVQRFKILLVILEKEYYLWTNLKGLALK